MGGQGSQPPSYAADLFREVWGALKEASGDLRAAVTSMYQRTLSRKPSGSELDYALTYMGGDPERMKELAWLLFNLDEFIYVR